MPDHDDKPDTPQQTARTAAQRGVRLTAKMMMDKLAREFDDPEALDEIWDEAFDVFEESIDAMNGDVTVVARLKYLDAQEESIGSLRAEMVTNSVLFRPDTPAPQPELAGHAAKHPPGGVPDQLIDSDVGPVEPTPEARRMVARLKEIKRTPRPVKLLLQCCRALKDVLQEYTDERLLVLGIPPFGDDGPKLSPGALRQLDELLGPRYRVVEAEPCEHDETFASVDDISRWCTRCGALRVDGEWRLPGTVDDA